MKKPYEFRCDFCGSTAVKLPMVGIALSMAGFDYSFCEDCLTGMTADEFWQSLFEKHGYSYPPVLAHWARKAVEEGNHPDEAIHGSATASARCPSSRRTGVAVRNKSATELERGKMTNSLRYRIMRRDSFHCVLCGATGKDGTLVIDHIVPIARGGRTEEPNLRTVCQKCNSGKGTKIEGSE